MMEDAISNVSHENLALMQNKNEVLKYFEIQSDNKHELISNISRGLFPQTEDEFTYGKTLVKLISIAGSMVFNFIILVIRYFLLFIFSRNAGFNQLEALGAVIPTYSILTFGASWSLTQGYGFKSSMYAGTREYRNLGLITNKAVFYSLAVGLVLFSIIFFFGGPFFDFILGNQVAVDKISIMLKYISISTPFQFWLMVSNRYFCAAMTPLPLLIGAVIGLAVEVIALLVLVYSMGLINVGIGLSFTLGTLAVVIYNLLNFIYNNPNPEAIVPFKLNETFDGLWRFIVYSMPIGLIVFFSMISLDLFPFLALMVNETVFASFGVIENIFLMTYEFGEAMALSTNIQLNIAKATNNIKYIKTILLASMTIIGSYLLLVSFLLLFFYQDLLSLYTTVSEVITFLSQIQVYFILCQIMLTLHSTLSESISSLGHVYYPLITLFSGRYLIAIVLSVILVKTTSLGGISMILAFFVGLVLTNVANIVKLLLILANLEEEAKALKIE